MHESINESTKGDLVGDNVESFVNLHFIRVDYFGEGEESGVKRTQKWRFGVVAGYNIVREKDELELGI